MARASGLNPIAVGLASGLGNMVFMLPAIKAIKEVGYPVTLYVQGDFPTAALWKRCIYADAVIEPPAVTNGHRLFAGEYMPPAWKNMQVARFPLRSIYDPVWQSNMRVAQTLGYRNSAPDVSDWCRWLNRIIRWDIGIHPGCKGGHWIRKRWPAIGTVADYFLSQGLKVAVFGLPGDGIEGVSGEQVDTKDISRLPDALAGCRVFIGGDSGVTHLASSLGIPTVMVYTATSEYKADPVGTRKRKIGLTLPCRPCVSTGRWQACQNWRCQEIDPVQVIKAAEELLEQTKA